jgi:hypothetical protein
MNLPNYFIGDLPPEATLAPGMITEACHVLRRNREQYLAPRSTARIIGTLTAVAQDWLKDSFSFRQEALEHGPAATGFPRATIADGLDAFFTEVTHTNLQALVVQDLGNLHRLDTFVAGEGATPSLRSSISLGPPLLVQVTAGKIPSPAFMSIVLGLLARSAQFLKCARGSSLLPRLFAHSIYETEPKLGACLEVAEWPGGLRELEDCLFAEADCVTVTGEDETLASVRARLPMKTRFLGYGHRVSFGYIAREVLDSRSAEALIASAASDVAAWNQMGCLSPHLFYVQSGGTISPEQFAERLGDELQERESITPRGKLSFAESAVIALKREVYQVRAAASDETRVWQSQNSTDWTVVCEADPRFQMSCLNRFVYVKPVADLNEALRGAEEVRGKVSTVGLASASSHAPELAMQLARWGVSRICPVGRMQRPPLSWRHDGRPALADLVTWTDWEQ